MTVRIGGGQGFYGDTPAAVDGLLADGIDYLCLEALAELTLAILQKDRQRDETLGYTRDLPRYLAKARPAAAPGPTTRLPDRGGVTHAAAARGGDENGQAARRVGDPRRHRARRRSQAAAARAA